MDTDAPLSWLHRILITPNCCIPLIRCIVQRLHETYTVYVEQPPAINMLGHILNVCEKHNRYEPLPLLYLTAMNVMETLAHVTRKQIESHSNCTISNSQWSLIMTFIDTVLITHALNSVRKDNAIQWCEQFNNLVRAVLVELRYNDMYEYVQTQRATHNWPKRVDEHFDDAVAPGLLVSSTTPVQNQQQLIAGDGVAAPNILGVVRQIAEQQSHLHTLAEQCVENDTILTESVVAYRTPADIKRTVETAGMQPKQN